MTTNIDKPIMLYNSTSLRSQRQTPSKSIDNQLHIPIVFLTKLYDDSVYDILVELIGYFSQDTRVRYYLTTQLQMDIIGKRYPQLKCQMFDTKNVQLEKSIRYVVTVGGDGTVLYAAKLFQSQHTPQIIAVEKGTLGFLCKFKLQQLNHLVGCVLQGDDSQHLNELQVEKKMRLRCQKKSTTTPFVYHSLNEVAITKANCETALRLEIYLQDELFTVTSGDGLLVSTPTGSTAYALSAGGPIIHNAIRTILIQPISPNSLSFRSICVPSHIRIKIKLSPHSKTNGFISYDGQVSQQLCFDEQMVIEESEFDVQLLSFEKANELKSWTHKLKSLLKFNRTFRSMQSIGLTSISQKKSCTDK